MELSMEEWNSRLKPKEWSSFHKCEFDKNLTEIVVDKSFTWGRPPLECTDSFLLCLPLRERLYSHLFGEIQLTNPNEGGGGGGSGSGSSSSLLLFFTQSRCH